MATTKREWMAFLTGLWDTASTQQALAQVQCVREGHVWRWALLDGEQCGSTMGGWWYVCGRCKATGQAHELPASGEE